VESLPEPVDLVTVDASFISLKTLLPTLKGWLNEDGQLIALIKPQFEAGKKDVGKGRGVIRDEQVHRRVLEDVLNFIEGQQFAVKGLMRSPVLGPKGNVEFLVWGARGEGSQGKREAFIENVFFD